MDSWSSTIFQFRKSSFKRQFAGLSHDSGKFANYKWWSSYCYMMVTVWVSHSCMRSSLLGLLGITVWTKYVFVSLSSSSFAALLGTVAVGCGNFFWSSNIVKELVHPCVRQTFNNVVKRIFNHNHLLSSSERCQVKSGKPKSRTTLKLQNKAENFKR